MNATTLPRSFNARFTHRGTDYMICGHRWAPSSPQYTITVYAPCSGPCGEYSSLTTFEGEKHDRGQWWGKVGTMRDLPAEIEALPSGKGRSEAVYAWYAEQLALALCVVTAAAGTHSLPVALLDLRGEGGSYSMMTATGY